MSIDIERLKVDRHYWNRVAPIGATHYGLNAGIWIRYIPNGSACYWDERWVLYVKNLRFEKDIGTSIPRPTKDNVSVEWDGDGMISVGEWCEGLFMVADGLREWIICRCVGFLNGMGIFCDEDETMVDLLNHTRGDIRPIRTKEQRQRDELADLIAEHIEIDMVNDSFQVGVGDAVDAVFKFFEDRYNLEPKP